jgi:hypothetical protein
MNLFEQILSFLFSFLYGIIIFFVYKVSYKYLYNVKVIYKFLNSLLFVLDLTFLYYLGFYFINDGIIHVYFLLITFLTFIYINDRHRKNLQKKM